MDSVAPPVDDDDDENDDEGLSSSDCDCDLEGSSSPHCSASGLCQCRGGATGRRCDSCLPGYTWRGGRVSCTGTARSSNLFVINDVIDDHVLVPQ